MHDLSLQRALTFVRIYYLVLSLYYSSYVVQYFLNMLGLVLEIACLIRLQSTFDFLAAHLTKE